MNQASNRPNSPESDRSLEQQSGIRGKRPIFDQVKSTLADKLHGAADALHEKSAQARGEREGLASYQRQAADWINRSADYIEDLNPERLKADLKNQVRAHPGRSLLIAGAAGLILGTILRRR